MSSAEQTATNTPAPATAPNATIFERIGGEAAVAAAVEVFYGRVLADPALEALFAGVDTARLAKHQQAFLTQALGGAAAYRGRSMRAAHQGLGITKHHFELVAGHLVATLDQLGVDDATVGEILGAVAPLAADIVEAE